MKRAFTLIELLVVIAIIAVLAAILFPVFAQAKEAAKKAQSISNTKQTLIGFALYSNDVDDVYPSQSSIGDGGACGLPNGAVQNPWYWYAVMPAGGDYPECQQTDGQAWVNSIQPYLKNYGILAQPGFVELNAFDADYMSLIKTPYSSGLTMNGFLHQYPASQVVNPASLPLVWAGTLKTNLRGGSPVSNPALICDKSDAQHPCRFNPSGMPVDGMDFTDEPYEFRRFLDSPEHRKVWHYARGIVMGYADGSAKFVQVNPNGAKKAPSYNQPFITFEGDGSTTTGDYTACSTNGMVIYPALFRPDRPEDARYSLEFAFNMCGW